MAVDTLISELSEQGVLRLTMNRPEVHNAFDQRQIIKLIEVLNRAADNESVRVIVLASEGRSFCAGGDIDYMRTMGTNSFVQNLQDGAQLAKLMSTLNDHRKPTIARVQGAAMGGGLGLVCCCDFAVGSNTASFAASEVKIGMVAATISPYIVATVGEKATKRLLLSGTKISAQRALGLGILSHCVSAEALDDEVDKLAHTLLKNAPQAMHLSKQIAARVASGQDGDNVINETVKLIAKVRQSKEGREGLTAFLEKRPPNWV